MSEDNTKHLSIEALWNQFNAIEKEADLLKDKINKFRLNLKAALDETPLGRMAKIADKAFEIIKQKGDFTSYDCTKVGVFDPTHKKRLFTTLKMRHPEIRTDIRSSHGDKRKIMVAWLDDQKFEETQKDPDQEMKEFIQEFKPAKDQLIRKFWENEQIGQKEISRLVSEKKICLFDGKKFIWIGK
jgi:hypothetical protein